jgi:hypothetical protein
VSARMYDDDDDDDDNDDVDDDFLNGKHALPNI